MQATVSTALDQHVANNTSSNNEPLGSNAGRAGSTSVRSDGRRAASGVGSADTTSASSDTSDLGAVVVALAVKPVGGGGNGEGDGESGEVGVSGDGDGGGVLDDSRGAAESGDGGLLDGAGGGDVGGRDGLGDGGAEGGGHGGRTSPSRGVGDVAVGVDAALGADGGVDAGDLSGGDVWHGGRSRVSRGSGVGGDHGNGGVARGDSRAGGTGGAGRRDDSGAGRGAGRSDSRRAGGARSDSGEDGGRRGSARGRAGAGSNRAVLVLGEAVDGASNVLSSLVGVDVEVVGVSLDGVSTKARCAHQIVDGAVVLESRGVGVQTSQTGGIAVAAGLASTSAQSVVGLVSSVPGVAPKGDSSDVADDTRCGVSQTSVSSAGALDGVTSVAGQDVTDNGRALAVAAQHNGGVGALGVVCIDLLDSKKLTGSDRRAVIGGVGIVGNVLVVTALARKLGTNAGGEGALTTRV